MRPLCLALTLSVLGLPSPAWADGLLVPTDRALPPLSLEHQRVRVTIDGQVATTEVEQVYRNRTDRDLEADYLFPLPRDAAVREFAMWVGGQRLRGETIEAGKARRTYEDIVRRLKDPGLLEYVDCDLWKGRIFPVPRRGEQKIEIKYTAVLPKDGPMIAYEYPLKTGRTPRHVAGDFSMVVELDGAGDLGPIYSPSHDVAINRRGDRRALVSFEERGCDLDSNFTLYFAPRAKDVGLSLMTHRDSAGEDGYFLLLLSPRAEPRERPVARDLVIVLDTSGSMKASRTAGHEGDKLRQARGALRYALDTLGPDDRFALIQFATVVTPFRDELVTATGEHLDDARAWVDRLEAAGGTNIDEALAEALRFRPRHDDGRTFQLLFLTDGLPTVGRTEPDQILKSVEERNSAATRIFTFGVGDDVNAHLLDQLAEATRAVSTYVRPGEDLEAKASALMAKIRHPVRTELRLRAGGDVRLVELYPPKLPDLFQGEQLQVAGRYEGHGHVALTLEGRMGERHESETFDAEFPRRESDHDFIPPLWARRKVGYLLDQIRLHGESSELRDEVLRLAREYGLATPYTSLLVVPDDPRLARIPALRGRDQHLGGRVLGEIPPSAGRPANQPQGERFEMAGGYGGLGAGGSPGQGNASRPAATATPAPAAEAPARPNSEAGAGGISGLFLRKSVEVRAPAMRPRRLDRDELTERGAREPEAQPGAGAFGERAQNQNQGPGPVSGKAAIDLAQALAKLKTDRRAEAAPVVKTVAGHRFRLVEGAWIDDGFAPETPTVTIAPFGAAYFRLLEAHPELKDVLALGDRVVWVGPGGTALVIDPRGPDDVDSEDLEHLFRKGRGG